MKIQPINKKPLPENAPQRTKIFISSAFDFPCGSYESLTTAIAKFLGLRRPYGNQVHEDGWLSSPSVIARKFLQSMAKPFNLQCKSSYSKVTQIAKFMGPRWGPPGSCRPQMGPMLAPWTLLSGTPCFNTISPQQNGWHFADCIFIHIFLNKKYAFWIQFHWKVSLNVWLTIN